jgi:hypothetical protein
MSRRAAESAQLAHVADRKQASGIPRGDSAWRWQRHGGRVGVIGVVDQVDPAGQLARRSCGREWGEILQAFADLLAQAEQLPHRRCRQALALKRPCTLG